MATGQSKGKRSSRRKRLAWVLEYILAMLAVLPVRMLPFSAAYALAGYIGGLAYRLDVRRRERMMKNLERCLNDRTRGELEDIACTVYRNLMRIIVELIHSARYEKESLESHFRFVNYEAFERANAKGRGVILLTAHCGSWELMALAQSLKGHPFGVVVRPLDNPYLDSALEKIRSRYGNTMINKKRGMREMLKTLSDGRSVGILLDQSVTRKEGVFVEFMGRPACTSKGLALIAVKTKAPVIPAFTRRVGPDMHEIVLGEEVPIADTGDKQADLVANTQICTKEIEEFVRKYPDQWFWLHRRWKTKPVGGLDA